MSASAAVLARDGLEAVVVTQLPDVPAPLARDASDTVLRLLLRGPSSEDVARAAGELMRADVGAHRWQYISGGPPDMEQPEAQRFSAVLHSAD